MEKLLKEKQFNKIIDLIIEKHGLQNDEIELPFGFKVTIFQDFNNKKNIPEIIISLINDEESICFMRIIEFKISKVTDENF